MDISKDVNKIVTKKKISHANRGLKFEKLIENKCEELQNNRLALIHKVPTDWRVTRVGAKIVNAYPISESKMVDFVGVYNKYSIAIEAKETSEEKRFPFANIKQSQIDFMNLWCELGGRGYYIIHFKKHEKVFWLNSKQMHNCIDTIGRKSAPYDYFLNNTIELEYDKLNFIDYIN